MAIVERRIGSGTASFIFGGLAFALGLLLSFGDLPKPGAWFMIIGVGLLAVGFWVRLFGALEQRLIDLQQNLSELAGRSSAPEPPPAPSSLSKAVDDSSIPSWLAAGPSTPTQP